MKKEHVNLDDLFDQSMKEMPSHVKRNIEHIPNSHLKWDWTSILSTVFLTPFIIWGMIKLSPIVLHLFTLYHRFNLYSSDDISLILSVPLSIIVMGLIGITIPFVFRFREDYHIK